MVDCVFCKIIERKIPSEIILEDNNLIVIKDIAPKAEIHYLIMPKKHVKDIQALNKENLSIASQIFQAAQELSRTNVKAQEFKLVSNNGAKAGQIVFHMHFHFLAGSYFSKFAI